MKDKRPSGKTCEDPSCRKSRRHSDNVKLFKFPDNPDERKKWATILNIPIDTISQKPFLCQDHFDPKHVTNFRLRKNAIPITKSDAQQLKRNQFQKYSSIKSGRSGKIDVVLIPTHPTVKLEPVDPSAFDVKSENIADLIAIKTESEPNYISMAYDQNDERNIKPENDSNAAQTVTDRTKCEALKLPRKAKSRKDIRLPGIRCKAPNCRKSKREHIDMVLHKFPTDSERRKAWASILNIPDSDLSQKAYVCSDHFHPKSIGRRFLKKNALPINIYAKNKIVPALSMYKSGAKKTNINAAKPKATITSTNDPDSVVKSNTKLGVEQDETESKSLYTAPMIFDVDMQTLSTDHNQKRENQNPIVKAKRGRLLKDKRLPGIICKVPNCRKSKRKNSDVVFYRFPSDSEKREVWARMLNIPLNELSITSCVCSDHFDPKSIGRKYLKKNAVPTLSRPTENKIYSSSYHYASTNQPESIVKSNTQSAHEQDEIEVDLSSKPESMYISLLNFEMKMESDDNYDNQIGELNQFIATETVANSQIDESAIPTDSGNEISCQKCHKLLTFETVTYSKIIAAEEKHNEHEPIAMKKRETVYRLREQYRQHKTIARQKRHTIRYLRRQLILERHRYDLLKRCAKKQSAFIIDILRTSAGKMKVAKKIWKMVTIQKQVKKRNSMACSNSFSAVFFVTDS